MHEKDLATFLKVAELGSVTLAAEASGRSQPSVTRCVQELEAVLGFKLFERIGRRISLTPEGAAFEEEAGRLVALFADLPARTLARATGAVQPMTISATYALGTGLVPHAIAKWPDADRPRDIRLVQGVPNAVAQDLLGGRARIGLASLPLDVPGVVCLRRFSAPLVAALPEGLAADFPEGAPVPVKVVAADALVAMLDETRLQGRIRQALDRAGAAPRRVMHANSSIAALQLVRLTGANAIVEPVTAYGAALPGVILRPLAEDIDFTFGFFAADGTASTRAATSFFDRCEEVLFALVPQVRRIDVDAPVSSGGRT